MPEVELPRTRRIVCALLAQAVQLASALPQQKRMACKSGTIRPEGLIFRQIFGAERRLEGIQMEEVSGAQNRYLEGWPGCSQPLPSNFCRPGFQSLISGGGY